MGISTDAYLVFGWDYGDEMPWDEDEGDICVKDWGKIGVFALNIQDEIHIPRWYTSEARLRRVQVRFAILCARFVLSVFETQYPHDQSVRLAIQAAESYLNNSFDAARAARAADADSDIDFCILATRAVSEITGVVR